MVEETQTPVTEEHAIEEEQRYAGPLPPEPQQTSVLAIISLATGIASWFILPIIGAVAAVITGYFAKQEIRESGGRLTGDGLATAGIVLGAVQLVLGLIALIIILALIGQAV